MSQMGYKPSKAPKIAVVGTSVLKFHPKAKEAVQRATKSMFDRFVTEGRISPESIYIPTSFGQYEVTKLAKELKAANLDLCLIINTAFPNGGTATILGSYLKGVPLVISSTPEPNVVQQHDWETNSVCGVLMNNNALNYMGVYHKVIVGFPGSEEYNDELQRMLNVAYTIREMRSDRLAAFGDRAPGFHASSANNELADLAVFGTYVETISLMAVQDVYNNMRCDGLAKTVTFTEDDVQATIKRLCEDRIVLSPAEQLYRSARYYQAFKAIVEANGLTSAAFRCWPEIQGSGVNICAAIGLLLSEGTITGGGCERDVHAAMSQTILHHLSGKPAVCLDFVDQFGRYTKNLVQMGHCGCGIPGCMEPAPAEILDKIRKSGGKVPQEIVEGIHSGRIPVRNTLMGSSVNWPSGIDVGPCLVGPLKFGEYTCMRIIPALDGRSHKMLIFKGQSSAETCRNTKYTSLDLVVDGDAEELFGRVLEHGFPHHLAAVAGDYVAELKELCRYWGIEPITV
ncbi:MAG: hypothetical protein QME79_01915 [Bacillota bacterium]|nr:hypothetical protein [Bacillota bacterium]